MRIFGRQPIDTVLLLMVLTISGLGLVMLLSASSIVAEERYNDAMFFFRPQVMHMALGFALMMVLSRINYQTWVRLAYPILGVALLLLLLVLIPGIGHEVGGARRWIRFPGMSIQPSELAKLAIVIFMAYSLSQKGDKIKTFSYGLLPHLMVLGFIVMPIMAEPDFGSSMLIICIAFTMMIVAGLRPLYVITIGISLLPVLVYQVVMYPYRLDRIKAFLDPWSDPERSGYHIIHSFYAFASGGTTGQGPGASVQKLFFLPESHTDFIFSIVGEELGFIGVVVVASLFLALTVRGIFIARAAKDFCGVYMALGCILVITMPAFLNMGVTLGLLPTTGLPLPFFSYGGSSVLTSFAAAGILMNISGQSKAEKFTMAPNAVKGRPVEAF